MTSLRTLGILVLTISFLSSCSNEKIVKEYISIDKPPLKLERNVRPKAREISFKVITDKNQSEIFDSMVQKNELPVLICLSPKDYQNLSINVQNNENYILDLQRKIKAYQEYYEKPKK